VRAGPAACRPVRSTLFAAALTMLGACAGEDAQITAHVAPELERTAPHPIAVFGVFRDGRMNTKAWDDLSPKLDALGLEPCGAAYDADLVTSAGDLASAIDDYTRSYGVTDTLLAAVGAAAKSDLILVFVVSGTLPKHGSSDAPPRSPPSPYRAPRGAYSPRQGVRRDSAALEITASLFSTSRRAGVAAVSLRYTGRSENEAFAQMNAKLRDLFPAAACAGWDLAAHPLDPAAVRSLPED
jgi:hypothetical protein